MFTAQQCEDFAQSIKLSQFAGMTAVRGERGESLNGPGVCGYLCCTNDCADRGVRSELEGNGWADEMRYWTKRGLNKIASHRSLRLEVVRVAFIIVIVKFDHFSLSNFLTLKVNIRLADIK